MSRIDKKYRQEFEYRQFPDSLKKTGWTRMEEKLDESFPVGPGSSSPFKNSGKLLLLAIALIGIAFIFWPVTVDKGSENSITPAGQAPSQEVIATEMEENPSTGKQQYEGSLTEETPEISPTFLEESSEARSAGAEKVRDDVVEELVANDNVVDNMAETAEVNQSPMAESPKSGRENTQQVASEELQEGSASYTSADQPATDRETALVRQEELKTGSKEAPSLPEVKPSSAELLGTTGPKMSGAPKIEEKPVVSERSTDPSEGIPGKPAEVAEPGEEDIAIADKPEEYGEEGSPANEQVTGDLKEQELILTEEVHNLKLNHLAFDVSNEKFSELPEDLKTFAPQRFSLSVFGGAAYTAKELQGGNADYLEKRRAEESVVTTYPMGMDLDYYLNKHWTFGTGVWWSQYGEELKYNSETTDSVLIDGRYTSPYSFGEIVRLDSTRIIDSINVGHWNYDVVYKTTDTAIENNNGLTSWRYTEIPLIVGYRFGKGRIKPWLRAGILVGFPTGGNFRYVDPQTGDLAAMGRFGELVAPLQFSYVGRAGFDFYLTRRFSIRLDALGTYQINSSLRNSTVSQRYYRLGGTLSLAYYF